MSAARTITIDEDELRAALCDELAPRRVEDVVARLRSLAPSQPPRDLAPEAMARAMATIRKYERRHGR